jgi:hypothetical protein
VVRFEKEIEMKPRRLYIPSNRIKAVHAAYGRIGPLRAFARALTTDLTKELSHAAKTWLSVKRRPATNKDPRANRTDGQP